MYLVDSKIVHFLVAARVMSLAHLEFQPGFVVWAANLKHYGSKEELKRTWLEWVELFISQAESPVKEMYQAALEKHKFLMEIPIPFGTKLEKKLKKEAKKK